jgi:hypothetical protein
MFQFRSSKNWLAGGCESCGEHNRTTMWTKHATGEGRTYYYNAETKVSSWTNPEEEATKQKAEAQKQNNFSSDGSFMEQVNKELN